MKPMKNDPADACRSGDRLSSPEYLVVVDSAVVLLIDHRKKSLLPLSQRGLKRTQKSYRRQKGDYPDATILLPRGEELPITDFVLGRSADLGLPWPLGWLTFTGERHLTLIFGEARTQSVEETRRTVLERLSRETHHDEWRRNGESWDQLLLRVRDASTHCGLFEALHLTSSEDGFDVFS
jgi:hypothetical protein